MNVMHTHSFCIDCTQNLFRIICVSNILTMMMMMMMMPENKSPCEVVFYEMSFIEKLNLWITNYKQWWSRILPIPTKRQITSPYNSLNTKHTMYDVGNPVAGLGQAHKCGSFYNWKEETYQCTWMSWKTAYIYLFI